LNIFITKQFLQICEQSDSAVLKVLVDYKFIFFLTGHFFLVG